MSNEVKIREGVFETNSSSCHSLVIKNNTSYDTFPPDDKGLLLIVGDGYGWGYDELVTTYSKLCYVGTLLEIARKSVLFKPNHIKEFVNNFESLVKEQTGAKQIEYVMDDAYIDHQSCDEYSNFQIFTSKKDLKNLIFGKSSSIIIDNDNR